MKKALTILLLSFSAFAFAQQPATVKVITTGQLLAEVDRPEDNTLYVVNFWATWCVPCVKEIPYFEEVTKKYGGKEVKVLLVSLDFISDTAKVKKFAAAKKLQSEVYQLNAGNPNEWIDNFETTWDGGIPATIFYKAGKKVYFR
ncbi:MAG: TlpA family protein disulfide reductase [Sphingobacteriales bacterium JAD_PAG50586_3]|nr:MAG: TlpA family protein disulfide reductase [Sphingobacteriales bacterium JAD_PAG50586_3]